MLSEKDIKWFGNNYKIASDKFDRIFICYWLGRYEGNLHKVSKITGISYSHLRLRLQQLDIYRKTDENDGITFEYLPNKSTRVPYRQRK